MNSNRKLAFIALMLSLIAMTLSLVKPNGWGTSDSPVNYISVLDLAQSIKKRDSLVILDLRSKFKYDSFHLPNAILKTKDFDISTRKNVVIYSGDDSIATNTWSTLSKVNQHNTRVLFGGVYDWFDYLLYPKLPINPTSEKDAKISNTINELAQYFGGQAEFIEADSLIYYYEEPASVKRRADNSRKKGLVRMGC